MTRDDAQTLLDRAWERFVHLLLNDGSQDEIQHAHRNAEQAQRAFKERFGG